MTNEDGGRVSVASVRVRRGRRARPPPGKTSRGALVDAGRVSATQRALSASTTGRPWLDVQLHFLALTKLVLAEVITMALYLKRLVSGNKARYRDDQLNLELGKYAYWIAHKLL